MPTALGPRLRAPYLTLGAPLCKGVYAQSADTAWEKYRDQLAALHQSTDREDLRQKLAWGAYQQLLQQAHADMYRSEKAGGLVKSGEGARGGHVIGHTPGGHPIYQSGHARYARMHVHPAQGIGQDAHRLAESFGHYAPADHAEAASAHFKQAYSADYGKKAPSDVGRQHLRAALAHNRLATGLGKSMPALVLHKAGPGSRGGHVIGTTSSGKPIYADGTGAQGYHPVDHADAAEAHNAAGFTAHLHNDPAAAAHHQGLARQHLGAAAGPAAAPKAKRPPVHQMLRQAFAQHAYAKSGTDPEKGFLRAYRAHVGQSAPKRGLMLDLSKGGEGSRGGKVIGHTASGKPIYQHGTGTGGYTPSDHLDARDAHTQAANKLGPKVGFKVAGAEKDPETRQKILNRIYDHRDLATDHLNEHKAATGETVFNASEYKKTPRASGAPNANISKSLARETTMTSAEILKSFLAKGKFKSGAIDDAETVDGLDAEMTGTSANGKSTSGPGGFDDQEDEDKKVLRRKYKPGQKNGGPTKTVESQTGAGSVEEGQETRLSNAGPYDVGGEVSTDIGAAAPTRLVDSNILRSMADGDLEKGGEGSRGGKIIGHTKSGKPVYGSKIAQMHYKDFGSQDHKDAAALHYKAADESPVPSAKWQHTNRAIGHQREADSAGESIHVAGMKFSGGAKGKTSKSAPDADAKQMSGTKKSMPEAEANSYRAANGQTYRQNVEVHGHVVHTTGGLDAYCADLAKGGHFWAHGDRHNPHSATDQSHLKQVLCKSCSHTHSEIYTACPHCDADRGLNKSFGHMQAQQANLQMPAGPGLVDMSAFRLED